jgi:hypothetical protein
MEEAEIGPGKLACTKGICLGNPTDEFCLGIHKNQELKCILFVIALVWNPVSERF